MANSCNIDFGIGILIGLKRSLFALHVAQIIVSGEISFAWRLCTDILLSLVSILQL